MPLNGSRRTFRSTGQSTGRRRACSTRWGTGCAPLGAPPSQGVRPEPVRRPDLGYPRGSHPALHQLVSGPNRIAIDFDLSARHKRTICARVAMTSTAVRRDDLCSRRHLPALRRYTAERSSVIAASGTSWMRACTTVHRVARRSVTLSSLSLRPWAAPGSDPRSR